MTRFGVPALLIVTSSAIALDASDFNGLEGWTVAAVTTVRGDFEGCDFEKRIRFDNGWTLTCSGYSYSYAYRPDAVIFSKAIEIKGRNYWMIKVLIDDEFYEMQPVLARVSRPRTP
jgi:hypothetical protein